MRLTKPTCRCRSRKGNDRGWTAEGSCPQRFIRYNELVTDTVQIGILGDYDPESPTLPAVEKSIQHAAETLEISAQAKWLPTPSLLDPDIETKLEAFDGLWAAPGSPYKSFDGMLRGIEFARRRDWPFVGT